MPKVAEALHTNENHRQKKLEELQDEPEGHSVPGNPDPLHPVNAAAWSEFVMDNPKLLGRAFDSYEASRRGDKSFMDQYFSGKDYESRSPLLRKYAQAGHVPSDSTLSERVRALTGRR